MVPRDQESSRLVVKLKLPKTENETTKKAVEIIEDGEELTKKSTHYCAECKRSFSSGKALGGHMSSAHVQANKDLSLKKLKSKLKKHQVGSASSSLGFICNICGKDFPSRKSVFGHMRCHPDREWRGMEPPRRVKIDSMEEGENYDYEEVDEEHDQVDSSPDLVSGPVMDLSDEPFKSWTVKARRGSNQADPELLNAVHQLIRLVNDDWDKSKVEDLKTISNKELELSDHKENQACGLAKKRNSEDVSLMKLNMSEENAIDDEKKIDGDDKGEKKATFQGSEPLKSVEVDEYDNKNTLSTKRKQAKCRTTTQKRPKIAMDLDEDASEFGSVKKDSCIPTTSPGKFSCNICKKRFATHQALGGHRSSHNKFKISTHNARDHMNQESQKEKYCRNSPATANAATTSSSATTNELSSGIKDDQMSPAVDEGYILTARKGVAFDLNEMPDAEEDYM